MSVLRVIGDRELAYLRSVSIREGEVQQRLRSATERLPDGTMAAVPECAQFLALLLQAIGARHVLEVGVFTGLTTLAMALALPENGRIVACDIPRARAANDLARSHWTQAGVADKIDLRIAPAIETMDGLIGVEGAAPFDLVFIDADKEAYDAYYERALILTRPRGLIVLDNMLWYGSVSNPSDMDPDTLALRALNAKLHTDRRVSLSMLPIGDGMTVALKLS